MTINKACFYSSLTHDGKNVAQYGLVLIFAIIGWVLGAMYQHPITTFITHVGTALNAFIVINLAVIALGNLIPLTETKGSIQSKQLTPMLPVVLFTILQLCFWGLYTMASSEEAQITTAYPDVTILAIVFIVLTMVTIPISFAYTRCKE